MPYIGHLLTAEGLKVDPEKEMPPSTGGERCAETRRDGELPGLGKFYEHLPDDCEILRQLTHTQSLWEWSEVQENAFKRLKDQDNTAPSFKVLQPRGRWLMGAGQRPRRSLWDGEVSSVYIRQTC